MEKYIYIQRVIYIERDEILALYTILVVEMKFLPKPKRWVKDPA